MGYWTNVEGNHNSKKASIKHIVKDVLDNDDLVWDHQTGDSFSFRFETVGIDACKSIQKIVERFKEFDRKAWIEIQVNTMFY